MVRNKIIVIDDDPTGSQTVHGCLLLTRWDVDTLLAGLQDDSPLFFILSNTRSMIAGDAEAVTREICINIRAALDQLAADKKTLNPVIVSRSDSTLRGHYPLETDVIAEELGPFDAHFLVPAFFEGGRFTRDSKHFLMVDGVPVPVEHTEFAKDSVFGFSTGYLPEYVAEKTGGRIAADRVERFLTAQIQGDSRERLASLAGNVCCVVDAENQQDLDHFARQLLQVAGEQNKRFLFRSAASLLTAFAALPPQPVGPEDMSWYVPGGRPGVILAGSHVSKTSQQLTHLLKQASVHQVLVDVEHFRRLREQGDPAARQAYATEKLRQVVDLHAAGEHVLIYTSRTELQFASLQERLDFGQDLSSFLMRLVQGLPETMGYLISKGGITSNDVLSVGLSLKAARVLGQILPGCSVVRCPADHERFADLPVVIFPGNVGDETSITRAYQILSGQPQPMAQAV